MRHLVLGLMMAFLLVSNQVAAGGAGPVAYLSNFGGPTVIAVDISSPAATPTSIPVGTTTYGVAVGPKGVYVTDAGCLFGRQGTLYVIDTTTPTRVVTPVPVGMCPRGVTVNHDGSRVYVANALSGTVSVINAVAKTVDATVTGFVGLPWGVTVDSVRNRLYVTILGGNNTVVMVDTTPNQPTTNKIVAGIPNLDGGQPQGVVLSPDGTCLYAADNQGGRVWVIKTNLIGDVSGVNPIVDTVTVGLNPFGVDVTPDGKHVYVSNTGSNNVSVIDIDPTVGCSGVVSSSIGVGVLPQGVSVSSDGSTVYVANFCGNDSRCMSGSLTAISVATPHTTQTISPPPSGLPFPIAFGHFVTARAFITVNFDVVPKVINLKAQGTIPVIIYGSKSFDVHTLDLSSLRLNGMAVKIKPNGELMASYGDTTGSGYDDVMVHFSRDSVQASSADATVTLTGETMCSPLPCSGTPIQGTATVTFIH